MVGGAAQQGARDLGGAQRRVALTLRPDDSIAQSLDLKAFRRALRPILWGAAHRDTSASGAIGTSALVLAVVDLGAHDALRALAGRPRTGRLVEVDVQAARRACGLVEGASGGCAALVEAAIRSALAVTVLAALAVMAVEIALVSWRSSLPPASSPSLLTTFRTRR
ncbi:hypothetical protein [Sorangium sp. So ce362]|uniref:hypothetical protein n=1 Tax=Sorangium sp. So ce362 TaxID=3133303 RepID=UPI003F5DF00D